MNYTKEEVEKMSEDQREYVKDLLSKKFLSMQGIYDNDIRDKEADKIIDGIMSLFYLEAVSMQMNVMDKM